MTQIDNTIDDYETAASIRATDFSQLGIDDFANVEIDNEGNAYGIVMDVPIKINDQPKEQEGGPGRDVGRAMTRGTMGASKALGDTLPLLGTPVDLVNEGLREVGELIGVDLASDKPFLGSEMIRDGVSAVVEFGNDLVPKGANEAFAEYVNEPPNSKILQSIVEEITKFGVNAVTPALYLRAFSVMSPFARSIAWGGIADFINAQPDNDGAISAVTKMLSGATPEERGAFANAIMLVVEKQESDPEIISKAREALDGMVIGGAIEKLIEGAVLGVKYAKNVNTDDLRERIVQAGARADERLGSVMRGETLSANPIGAAGDMALSAAGKVAKRLTRDDPGTDEPFSSKLAGSLGGLGTPRGGRQIKHFREAAKDQGYNLSDEEITALRDDTLEIHELRKNRFDQRRSTDPLLRANIDMQRRLDSFKTDKRVKTDSTAIDELVNKKLWRKDFAEKVKKDIKYSKFSKAATRANLEAIPRLLKKEGWTLRYSSKNRGRASSRYIVSPDEKFEIRVSDHNLPPTPEREYNQATFGTRYSDELIVDDSIEGPEEYIDQIKNAYKEFLSEQ